jgi:putative redox protein
MPKATVHLNQADGYRVTVNSRHHQYFIDEPTQDGGTDVAPTPTETVMGALGACIAITIKMYAERKQIPLESIEIALDFERFSGKDYPAYAGDELFVHEIRESIVLHGALTADQKDRLLEIAGKCPVARLIALPTFWKQDLLEALPVIE